MSDRTFKPTMKDFDNTSNQQREQREQQQKPTASVVTNVSSSKPPLLPTPTPDALALPSLTSRTSRGLRVMFMDEPHRINSTSNQSPLQPSPPPTNFSPSPSSTPAASPPVPILGTPSPTPPLHTTERKDDNTTGTTAIGGGSNSLGRLPSLPISLPISIPSASASPQLSPRSPRQSSPLPSPTSTTVSFSEYVTSELNDEEATKNTSSFHLAFVSSTASASTSNNKTNDNTNKKHDRVPSMPIPMPVPSASPAIMRLPTTSTNDMFTNSSNQIHLNVTRGNLSTASVAIPSLSGDLTRTSSTNLRKAISVPVSSLTSVSQSNDLNNISTHIDKTLPTTSSEDNNNNNAPSSSANTSKSSRRHSGFEDLVMNRDINTSIESSKQVGNSEAEDLFESGESELDIDSIFKTKSHGTVRTNSVRRSETLPAIPSMSFDDEALSSLGIRHHQTANMTQNASLKKPYSFAISFNDSENNNVENNEAINDIRENANDMEDIQMNNNNNKDENENTYTGTRARGINLNENEKNNKKRRKRKKNSRNDNGDDEEEENNFDDDNNNDKNDDDDNDINKKNELPRHFQAYGTGGYGMQWMKLDCYEINNMGHVTERSMTRAEIMQQARSAGPNPLLSTSIFGLDQEIQPTSNSTATTNATTSEEDQESERGLKFSGRNRNTTTKHRENNNSKKKSKETDFNTLYDMLSSTTVPTESKKAIRKTLRDYLRNSLQMRDIRQVDPAFAAKPALWVRHSAIVVSLDGLRSIILHDRMFIFDSSKNESKECVEIIRKFILKNKSEEEQQDDEMMNNKQPFEFNALEGILIYLAIRLEKELEKFKPYSDKYVNRFPNELTPAVLEDLRRIKQRLKQLMSRLNNIKQILEGLLDDNDEMINMYLTEKYINNIIIRNKEDHSEIEMLLEAYLQVIDEFNNGAELLDHAIDDSEGLVMIHLDTLRNKLLSFEVSLSIITMFTTFASIVAGTFGMNFNIGVFNQETNDYVYIFWIVIGAIVCIVCIPTAVITWYLRKTGFFK